MISPAQEPAPPAPPAPPPLLDPDEPLELASPLLEVLDALDVLDVPDVLVDEVPCFSPHPTVKSPTTMRIRLVRIKQGYTHSSPSCQKKMWFHRPTS